MITMLNDHDARRFFQSARVARLGCIVNGEPYVVPINYTFEDGSLYCHSLPGNKINGLRKNPRACVQVDEIEGDLHWQSVTAFGKYEEVTSQNERAEILGKLMKQFPLLTPVEAAICGDGCPPEVIVFRIKIDRVTGVSEG